MIFRILLVAWVMIAPAGSCRSTPVVFNAEVIRIRLENRDAVVEGSYDFVAEAGGFEPDVWYPIDVDGGFEVLSLLAHRDGEVSLSLPMERHRDGIAWVVPAMETGACRVEVRYRQSTPDQRMRYIMTSARGWGRPLKRVRLEVIVPKGLKLRGASYPLVPSEEPERTVYSWESEWSEPERDLVLIWGEQAAPTPMAPPRTPAPGTSRTVAP